MARHRRRRSERRQLDVLVHRRQRHRRRRWRRSPQRHHSARRRAVSRRRRRPPPTSTDDTTNDRLRVRRSSWAVTTADLTRCRGAVRFVGADRHRVARGRRVHLDGPVPALCVAADARLRDLQRRVHARPRSPATASAVRCRRRRGVASPTRRPASPRCARVIFVLLTGWVVMRPERVIDPATQLPALALPGLAVATLGFSRSGGQLPLLGYVTGIAHALAMAVWLGGLILLARVVLAGPGEEDLVHAVRGFARISDTGAGDHDPHRLHPDVSARLGRDLHQQPRQGAVPQVDRGRRDGLPRSCRPSVHQGASRPRRRDDRAVGHSVATCRWHRSGVRRRRVGVDRVDAVADATESRGDIRQHQAGSRPACRSPTTRPMSP